MRVILLLLVTLVVVQGCVKESPPLKSPCVGAEGSPCDNRRAINNHWLFS